MGSTSATFVIDFGSLDTAFLAVELDNVKNNDKSSFAMGDEVFFKVYSDCTYTIQTTAGTIKNGNINVSEKIENEVVQFIKDTETTTQKKVASSIVPTWFGNNLGVVTSSGTTQIKASESNSNTLGICSLTYSSEYNEHSVTPPASTDTTYHILIYIEAVA